MCVGRRKSRLLVDPPDETAKCRCPFEQNSEELAQGELGPFSWLPKLAIDLWRFSLEGTSTRVVCEAGCSQAGITQRMDEGPLCECTVSLSVVAPLLRRAGVGRGNKSDQEPSPAEESEIDATAFGA